jgi:hypothetical protein
MNEGVEGGVSLFELALLLLREAEIEVVVFGPW